MSGYRDQQIRRSVMERTESKKRFDTNGKRRPQVHKPVVSLRPNYGGCAVIRTIDEKKRKEEEEARLQQQRYQGFSSAVVPTPPKTKPDSTAPLGSSVSGFNTSGLILTTRNMSSSKLLPKPPGTKTSLVSSMGATDGGSSGDVCQPLALLSGGSVLTGSSNTLIPEYYSPYVAPPGSGPPVMRAPLPTATKAGMNQGKPKQFKTNQDVEKSRLKLIQRPDIDVMGGTLDPDDVPPAMMNRGESGFIHERGPQPVFTPRQASGLMQDGGNLHPHGDYAGSRRSSTASLASLFASFSRSHQQDGTSALGPLDFQLPMELARINTEDARQSRTQQALSDFPKGRTGVIFKHDPMFIACVEWILKSDLSDEDFGVVSGSEKNNTQSPLMSQSSAHFNSSTTPGLLSGTSGEFTLPDALVTNWDRQATISRTGALNESLGVVKSEASRSFSPILHESPSAKSFGNAPTEPTEGEGTLRGLIRLVSPGRGVVSPSTNQLSPATRQPSQQPEQPYPTSLTQYMADLCAEVVLGPNLDHLMIHHTELRAIHVSGLVERGLSKMEYMNLTKLSLTFCHLTTLELRPLFEWIATAPAAAHLISLDISHNRISSDSLDLLRESLNTKNCRLEFLNVRNNQTLGEDGALSLVYLVSELAGRCLQGVDAGFCDLNDNTIVKLAAVLQQKGCKLTHLVLDGANVSQRAGAVLLDAVVINRSLLYLSLKYIYYCNGRLFLKRVTHALKKNATRKLRQIYNRPLSPTRPASGGPSNNPLSVTVDGVAVSPRSSLKGVHASPRGESGSDSGASGDDKLSSLPRLRSALKTAPTPTTTAAQTLQVNFSLKMMEHQTRSSGFSSSDDDSEEEEEDLRVREDDFATMGSWEWRGLRKGYTAYTTNTPSAGAKSKPVFRAMGAMGSRRGRK